VFLRRHPFPELICGFDRSDGVFSVPGDYPASCPIQAWSAGALFQMLQSVLGVRVADGGQRLYVSPDLPQWLTSVELKNLTVGGSLIHLYFSRDDRGNTLFKIVDNPNRVEVVVVS
jgi:glycogen debranching enzyme